MAVSQGTDGDPDGGEPGTTRILLVEDDLDHATLMKNALPREAGYRVTHVRTGADAIEAASQQAFDAILVDQRLPDHEGVNLCGELRKGFEGPILLVTALARESAVERAFEMGADDYLVKEPGMMKRLADEIARHLGS